MIPRVLMRGALLLGLVALAASPALRAESDADTIATLKAQLDALTARLEALESRDRIRIDTYAAPAPAAAAASAPGWTDRIKWQGDFRYRHETIDAGLADKDRHRNRIRARPALEAQVSDTVTVGMGLATGGEQPTSSNQTLGGGFSSKNIRLDLAYFDWRTPLEGLDLLGGKYKNPLHRVGGNGLIWDSDVRPEGMSLQYAAGGFRAVGMTNWVSESADSDDISFGGQLHWSTGLGAERKLLMGTGYYNLSSIEGRQVPFGVEALGNSLDAMNRYLYGYEELEVFAELSFDIGNFPATLFADYVNNLDADDGNEGWTVGGSMHFQHRQRPWTLGYSYQDLEADAVFALFTDSDFAGGGTDNRGHIIRGNYALSSRITLGGTLIISERNVSTDPEDFNRLMLDVMFKY